MLDKIRGTETGLVSWLSPLNELGRGGRLLLGSELEHCTPRPAVYEAPHRICGCNIADF